MRKPVTLRRTKTDGRTLRTLLSYDVCHDGVVLAKIQQDNKSEGWFWYGLNGVSGNTASGMRDFDTVKAEVVGRCKQFIAVSVTSPVRPCPGCDGHECDSGCAYPGAVSRPNRQCK